jgi:hypothetical protein
VNPKYARPNWARTIEMLQIEGLNTYYGGSHILRGDLGGA